MTDPLPIDGLHLARDERVIHLSSERPLAVTSSALVGGDLDLTRHIINMHVRRDYDGRTPADDLNLLARQLGVDEPFVGMMTAARLDNAQLVIEKENDTTVIAMVTLGISNPVAAGVTTLSDAPRYAPGTINTILVIDASLPRSARVNAILTATEAKTLALVEANVRAPHGGFASGTSTDSIVVATTERGAFHEYAGPLAPIGGMIGRAVRRAMENALK